MKRPHYTARELRTAISFLAVAIGVFICIVQHHFTLLASDPSTFLTMPTHRCGQVLLASLIWSLIEIANLLDHRKDQRFRRRAA